MATKMTLTGRAELTNAVRRRYGAATRDSIAAAVCVRCGVVYRSGAARPFSG